MSDGYRRDRPAPRRLGHADPDDPWDNGARIRQARDALVAMALVGAVGWCAHQASAMMARRTTLAVAEQRCAHNHNPACQEAIASLRTANAGDDIVDLALWQFVAGVVGIYLIAATLRSTRDAVRAANAANDIARQLGETDLRPWVDIDISNVEASDNATTFHVVADILLTNLGKTPALNVRCRARLNTLRHGGNADFAPGEWSPPMEARWFVQNLLPGGKATRTLHPSLAVERIAFIRVSFTVNGQTTEGAPTFDPDLEVVVDYEWGHPSRPGRTSKTYQIGAIRPGWDEKDPFSLQLGERPPPKVGAWERRAAEVT